MNNLREFLDKREQELLKEIDACHGKLVPLEAELAEVRRAKGALGIQPQGALRMALGASIPRGDVSDFAAPSGALQSVLPADSWQNNSGDVAAHYIAAGRRRRNIAATMMSTGSEVLLPPPSPYQHLTMKQLVVKALREHFPLGATARQLIDFFRDAWGCNIERANLSPQLSRLYQDGVLGRREDHYWFLLGHPDVEQLARHDDPSDS